MTTEGGERKHTLVAVRSAQPSAGKFGPQWVLQVTYPWMQPGKTTKAWVPRDEFGPTPEPGQYSCLVEKGERWATDSPGDEDWGYNWRIIGGLTGAEATEATEATEAAPPKPLAPLPDMNLGERLKSRRTALMCTSAEVVAAIQQGKKPDDAAVIARCDLYASWLDKVFEKPEDARTEPQAPQQPTDPLEGSDEPFPGGEPW